MKCEEKCWCSLVLLIIFCFPVFSKAVAVADDRNSASINIFSTVPEKPIAPLEPGIDGQAPSPPPQTSDKSAQKPYGWHIAIYPVLAWAPVFGASVTLPSLPSQPIATPGPSGSTSGSLNGAYFGGVRVERGKWSGDALFMWVALSGERKTPFANIHLDFVFGHAVAGREVLPGLYVEASMWRAEPGGWRWTFVPPSGHRAPAVPLAFGILSSVSVIVDSWSKVANSIPRRWRRIRRRFRQRRNRNRTRRVAICSSFRDSDGVRRPALQQEQHRGRQDSHHQPNLAWAHLWFWHFLLAF